MPLSALASFPPFCNELLSKATSMPLVGEAGRFLHYPCERSSSQHHVHRSGSEDPV